MNGDEPSFRAYYLGLPEAGGRSFRADIQRVVPRELRHGDPPGSRGGMLGLDAFWEGGRADFLSGRQRTQFIVACYFTVLIDQVIHHHFRHLHPRFEALTAPPKLCTSLLNVHPALLLEARHLRGDADPETAFREAEGVFCERLRHFSREHMPELDHERVWSIVRGILPYPGAAFPRPFL